MNGRAAASLRLFTLVGAPAVLHWSGATLAYEVIFGPVSAYSNPLWYVLEYLALVALVLLHEFGHAIACRQVGGEVESILLGPHGGAARVLFPPRPAPLFWMSLGGLLVNVALVPVLFGLFVGVHSLGNPWLVDLEHFLRAVCVLNGFLVVFNLLPIYPLDGGLILHAILWALLGRGRSLQIVSFLGLISGIALFGVTINLGAAWIWTSVLAGFVIWQSILGFVAAEALSRPGVEHLTPGHFHQSRGDHQRAVEEFTKAMTLTANNRAALATAHVQRGLAYIQLAEYDKALADHIEAVRLAPTAITYFARGETRLVRGEYEQAIRDFSQALEFDRKFAAAYSHRGDAYFQMGHYDWALLDRDQARAIDPTCPEIYRPRVDQGEYRFDFDRAMQACSRELVVTPVERRRSRRPS